MNQAIITIFIPTYRRPKMLQKAVNSVLNQSLKELQVVICDNASGDETKDVVQQIQKSDPRVVYYCHKENIGMLSNYKFCLSIVNTQYFSFLSDDDIILPWFCADALQYFSDHPDVAFFASSTLIFSEDKKIRRVPLSLWSREGRFDPPSGLYEMIGRYPVPNTVLFKTSSLENIEIDFQNPYGWDCDFLMQIASRHSIAISKKPSGIFLSHSGSFTSQQHYKQSVSYLLRLIERVGSFDRLEVDVRKKAVELLKNDLLQVIRGGVLSYLMRKQLSEARDLFKLKNYLNKNCWFLCFAIYFISLFPVTYRVLRLLKMAKKRFFLRKVTTCQYEQYAKWLFE